MKFDFVTVNNPGRHPKKIILILFLAISALQTYTQDLIIPITGTYQKTPLKSFIADIESRYAVKFFYDEKSLDTLTVTSNFKQTPLQECLEQILDKRVIHYFISGNEIILYQGLMISELFPGGDISVYNAREIPSGKKISREDLDQIQYQIINIGTPGRNKSNTATLTGHLRNFESGEPVIGGNIYTSDKHAATNTDALGYYRINLPVGNHVLNFSSIGMEQVKRNINVYSDGMLDVDMLEKVDILEDAVIIGHGEGNVGQIHAGMERIDIITIKSIPTLLGEADIIKSVLTLPGVQTVGEGTSGFNVRGGDTDQNLILIDQAPVYYPSHFFGNFSAINSEIIEDATLYKGSIPVKYGGRISSVFEINTIEGNHEKISGSAGISPISLRLNIDGPLLSKKSTFIASFRSTYSNWILTKIKVPELYKSKAGFYDALVKLNLHLNDKNRLLISFYNSNDKFQLHSDTSYNYNNLIASLSLKHDFNPRLKSSSSLICSLFKYEISNRSSLDQSFSLTHNLNNIALIHDFDLFTSGKMKYGFGAAFNFFSINPGERNALNNSNITPVNSMNERAIEFGIYAGSEYNITGSLKLEGGIRISGLGSFDDGKKYIYAADLPYEMDNITDTIYNNRNRISKTYFRPEWRLSLNYSAGRNSSIKFSYNKTSQYIHMLSNTMAISPTDTWKLSDVYLLPETGNQISAGYFQNFLKNRVEASA